MVSTQKTRSAGIHAGGATGIATGAHYRQITLRTALHNAQVSNRSGVRWEPKDRHRKCVAKARKSRNTNSSIQRDRRSRQTQNFAWMYLSILLTYCCRGGPAATRQARRGWACGLKFSEFTIFHNWGDLNGSKYPPNKTKNTTPMYLKPIASRGASEDSF